VILHGVKEAEIQQGRKRTFSQKEYGKNLLVFGDGRDGENKFSTTTQCHGIASSHRATQLTHLVHAIEWHKTPTAESDGREPQLEITLLVANRGDGEDFTA
jgi:hypothetical protein